jgi:hypothetical protein
MTILGKHVIMKETLIVIISGREESATMVRKTGKMPFKVIDSSLRVTIPFPVFSTKNSYFRSE